MKSAVVIEGLRLHCVIGVYGWERQVRQELLLDLELAWPTAQPAASDDVAEALDYAAVSARVREFAAAREARLVETLAEEIAQLLRDEYGVSWLRLHLRKPGAVPEADSVGVMIERGDPVT